MAVSNASPSAVSTEDRELVFTRVFDAPREMVYEAWTNPKHLAHWWDPRGFTTTISEMNVRPGGVWRLVMRGPDGTDYKNKIVFLEVAWPERLVYKHDPEKDSEPVSFEVTVTFSEKAGKTEVTMRMLFPSSAAREHVVKKYGAIEGANQTLGRLEEHLAKMAEENRLVVEPGKLTVVLSRVFDAPRQLVFETWTKPEHLKQWWGPRGFSLSSCEMEFRPGGSFRWVMRGPDGKDYGFGGVYREIVSPSRIVFSGTIDHVPGDEVWTEVTFAEEGGKTKLTVQQTHTVEAPAIRGALAGWGQSLDRLLEYVAQL